MIIIDIASLFKQYNATNYSMQILQLCMGPFRLGPRATAPSAPPPLIRHWLPLSYSYSIYNKIPWIRKYIFIFVCTAPALAQLKMLLIDLLNL